jgi:CO/xanthine dehydrogenase Mo-binding subunit
MVRVRIPEIGGCFGYKSDITVEQTVAWIASHVPGRPVKWVAPAAKSFTTPYRPRFRHKIRSAQEGRHPRRHPGRHPAFHRRVLDTASR